MANDNAVTIVGNVTRDPELRFTPTGQATATFGVAVLHIRVAVERGRPADTARGPRARGPALRGRSRSRVRAGRRAA